MRVSFALAWTAESLSVVPSKRGSHRKNAERFRKKLKRQIIEHGIITWEGFFGKIRIFFGKTLYKRQAGL